MVARQRTRVARQPLIAMGFCAAAASAVVALQSRQPPTHESAQGFTAFYGHYGGAAIDASGRLHAVWGAGEPGYRTGTVWVNSLDLRPR